MNRCSLSRAFLAGALLTMGQVVMADDAKPQAAVDPDQLFKELDKNSDGQLSSDEVSEDRKRFFERLVRIGDKNSDGKLSSEEFQHATKADDRPVEAPRGEGGLGARPNPEDVFKRLDKDGDGKLTKSELPEPAKAYLGGIFDRLGKDEITKEEFLRAGRFAAGRPGAAGGGNPEEFFKRMDTNGDGKVTLDEVPERGRQMVERLLSTLGRDKDSSISKDEFLEAAAKVQAGARRGNDARPGSEGRPDERRGEGNPAERGGRDGDRPPLPRIFEKLDTNHDGKISPGELAKAADHFKELDENSDGQLDPRELLGPRPDGGRGPGRETDGDRPGQGRPGAGRPEAGRGTPPGGTRPGGGRGPGGGAYIEQVIKQFDKNGDGKISKEEAPERLKDRFDQMDRNGDGYLDASDVPRGAPGGGTGRRPGAGRPGAGRPEQEKGDSRSGLKA